ncbi:methyl-binding domain 4 [Micractinium conductrix]|uniref:Methyl-CpG-binding domain protein 4 n=1 Tax=Micractinium conductrix TaxID=554055 RepID=A0A2P6VLS1_9CHLO|nr:methyl-binding domain 4 [Micractinium conductrix]|eukprot:PSC75056.1 methyl-binding domain 4 [Micractinium conductrix]
MQQAGAAGKRPAAAEQQLRPAKFRRVAPPELQAAQQAPPPAALQQEQQQQRQGGAAATPRDRRKQQQRQAEAGMGSPEGAAGMDMDIDMVSPRKRAAAAALERHATAGGATSPATADFLARLGENMQLRHQERQAGAEPHPLLGLSAAKRRRSTSHPAGSSPSAPSPAAGTAQQAQQEADPRLCLWEPPVSPYGLLEEELYDDPWKLLVACMLLNKTSGAQVRKVIWELFSLCPTPAAAIAADVQQVQNLIQPLGLFRKRALAIQQLSHEYLYKVWRDPTELYGIGKYAADAYLMFSRGRWREVQPDDKDLKRYHEWLESTGGLGTGLTRHRTVPPAAAAAAQQ